MTKPIPAVITGSVLAGILKDFAAKLERNMADDHFLVKHDSKSKTTAPPELAVVIAFDPENLTPKTVKIANAKRVAKDWEKTHSGR